MFYSIGPESMDTEYFSIEKYNDVFCFPHIHHHAELFFVLDGIVQMNLDTECYTLKKNSIAVVMPYQIHDYSTPKDSRIIVIEFPPNYLSEYRSLLEGKTFETPVLHANPQLQAMLIELVQQEHPDIFYKKALIYYAFSQLSCTSNLKKLNTPKDDTFRKAIHYMTRHFKESLTLDTVSTAVGVTPVHLSRMFSQKTDFCFTELVNIIRLQEAVHLLQTSTLSISNIAFEAGFNSIRNFNRIFEKYFHCTPKQYRSEEHIPL